METCISSFARSVFDSYSSRKAATGSSCDAYGIDSGILDDADDFRVCIWRTEALANRGLVWKISPRHASLTMATLEAAFSGILLCADGVGNFK